MNIYDKVKQPPTWALKTIGGGKLRGYTDINPQWRIQAITELFGPVGVGWWYTIDKLWTEPGAKGETLAFALVSLYYRESPAAEPSHAVPGIGGSTLIATEKGALASNDEAYKMAVTDALSVAMKAIGIAGDIYAGAWDGSKYSPRQTMAPTAATPPAPPPIRATDQQIAASKAKLLDMTTLGQISNAISKCATAEAFLPVIGDITRSAAIRLVEVCHPADADSAMAILASWQSKKWITDADYSAACSDLQKSTTEAAAKAESSPF